MKKLFLVGVLALSTVFAASAQGDTYTILPTIGKFISSDVAVGAQLGYEGSKAGDAKTNKMIIAPLVRKYWNISGGLHFFGQASLPVSFGDTNIEKEEILENKIKNLGVNFELAPGFDYIINDKFSIETSFTVLSLGYNQKKEGDWKKTEFGVFANEDQKFGDLKIGFKMIF